jgi:16S rRNA (cytidine1402-2'-O)-methyltransferase
VHHVSAGRVILAATPLGNAGDASSRLAQALASADVVAAEDTRRVRRLAGDLQVSISGRLTSFFDGNERARVPGLLDDLRAGADVLVVTDAGMPALSDPGYRLVAAAVAEGIEVTVLPGPSAITAALAVSGLPVDRFCFEGFLPRKAGERRRAFAAFAHEPRTVVFFESPRRLATTLAGAVEELGGERPAVVCRELTKTYEEIRRGTLAELADWAAENEVRGEITVVLGGAVADRAAAAPADLAAEVAALVAGGIERKAAIRQVATRRGLPKREVYQATL